MFAASEFTRLHIIQVHQPVGDRTSKPGHVDAVRHIDKCAVKGESRRMTDDGNRVAFDKSGAGANPRHVVAVVVRHIDKCAVKGQRGWTTADGNGVAFE